MMSLALFLFMSHFETPALADSLVAPPSASMQFQAAPPVNRPANAGAGGAMNGARTQTNQPVGVAPQQALPAQGMQGAQPISYPTAVPNVTNQQNQNQAMMMLQQIMQMLGGAGNPPGAPPMYLPNGQINPAWTEYSRGRPNDPYYGRQGTPNYDRQFPGLAQVPTMNVEEAARRLKGHRCTPNDRDRLACMVCNLMFEAGNEPAEGQTAVARSVMTRAFSKQYPDTVCKVVYQSNGSVAQYSWTLENKDHTLPSSSKTDDLIRIALDAMKNGPNGLTNYYAWRLVSPSWGRTGECANTSTRIYNHQFCTINGSVDRSVDQYLRAEGLTREQAPTATPSTNR